RPKRGPVPSGIPRSSTWHDQVIVPDLIPRLDIGLPCTRRAINAVEHIALLALAVYGVAQADDGGAADGGLYIRHALLLWLLDDEAAARADQFAVGLDDLATA